VSNATETLKRWNKDLFQPKNLGTYSDLLFALEKQRKIVTVMMEALEDHGITHPISERALKKCAEIVGEK
jgi:hypothetical protein